MGSTKGELMVAISKKEVVAALVPVQDHWLPLTNLDLFLPPLDKALAQALISYYAFSGEVVPNTLGEPELLCNNRGVDFIEAYADIDLQNLNFYNPDDTIQGKFVPKKKRGVLSVQATELKCGGVVVGCAFDHRVADAYSTNMFLVSRAEIAESKPVSKAPSFRRSLLNPRRPGRSDPSLDDMYVPIPSLPPPEECHEPMDHLISRIYYVTADQINELQSLASSNGDKRTKLESFSAFLWKMVATFGTKDRDKVSKMGIVVDGRSRLGEEDEEKASLMASHFGNVLSIPYGTFPGTDWVEAHRPEPAMTRVYCVGKDDGPALVVSSGQRFPVSKVDFGWGRPIFGSYVMPMPSPVGNGDEFGSSAQFF
ncbi:hypothetical protein PTKIN_Ptkin18bG0027000 [Pterospermum kingtungense]